MLLANVHFMLQKRSEGNSIEIEGIFKFFNLVPIGNYV